MASLDTMHTVIQTNSLAHKFKNLIVANTLLRMLSEPPSGATYYPFSDQL